MSEKYPKKRAYAHPKLAKFLKEKGALKQFNKNCKLDRSNLRKIKNISMAFVWSRTEEKEDFWFELEREYYGQA